MHGKGFYQGLKEESLVCARCGYCRVECPTYQVIGWESASPRARMSIARELVEAPACTNARQIERIYQCTLCGKCREICSTDIDTLEVWRRIRERIARAEKNPVQLKALSSNVLSTGNTTGEDPGHRELWLENLEESFRERVGVQAEYLYFTGCSSALFPVAQKIPQSMVQILAAAQVDFTLLGRAETCCGFPLIGSGEFSKAKEDILAQIAKISSLGVKKVVTTCPSCYNTMKTDWPKMLGQDLPFVPLHASQLLVQLIAEQRLQFEPLNEKVTYHDPCDLGRNGGEYAAPRAVLASIPGLEVVEMKKTGAEANCCGGGGNLEAVDPELVGRIALNRLKDVQETGANTVVSSCQQCKRTLYSAARKNKLRVSVLDLTELVLKALMI